MIRVQDRISGRKAKEVYETVRRLGTVSKLALLEMSTMSPSSLTRLLEDLTERGLLEEIGFGESTGGRRPILYRTNPRYAYTFGLEISRTRSQLVLTDLHRNVLDSRTWGMDDAMTPHKLLSLVSRTARGMLEKREMNWSDILGIGVGAVGPLDPEDGVIADPLYFPGEGWRNVPVVRMLESELQIPVFLDNGANAALLAEYWADSVKRKHLLYVHVGAGLRSAMMANGSLVYGAVDMEGAVGQMVIDADGRMHREPAGNRGALESYVSIYALERNRREKGLQGDFNQLLRELEKGDPGAEELLCEAGFYFGIGLANLLNVLHPEKVILGGPLVQAHPCFFETAVAEALTRTYYFPSYQVSFGRGELGDAAISVGAAILVANRMTE